MLESFLVAGRQNVAAGHELTYGQSITDACMDWDATVDVLDGLAAAVRDRRADARPGPPPPLVRVALAGVGLIGGSIGLAARERLGAYVVGYNRSPAALELALERGAIDEAATSIAAIGTADIAIAGVAVDALPATVRALCEALPGAVVTDVGSTKAALVGAIDHPNFIGGHPLAGAEATGVAHARADLFEGATWYLTPRPATPGVLYERLARFVAGLGAVPTAIAPADHDRLMAVVSHLPHVVANLLVAPGRRGARRRDAARDRPELSRRHPGRGLQPGAVGADLQRQPRRARHADRRPRAAPGGGARAASTPATAPTSRRGRRSPPSSAARCCRSVWPARTPARCSRSRRWSPTRPGVVAEIALALGRAGINITDMSLAPEADNRTGMVMLWLDPSDAPRAIGLIAELGYPAA